MWAKTRMTFLVNSDFDYLLLIANSLPFTVHVIFHSSLHLSQFTLFFAFSLLVSTSPPPHFPSVTCLTRVIDCPTHLPGIVFAWTPILPQPSNPNPRSRPTSHSGEWSGGVGWGRGSGDGSAVLAFMYHTLCGLWMACCCSWQPRPRQHERHLASPFYAGLPRGQMHKPLE